MKLFDFKMLIYCKFVIFKTSYLQMIIQSYKYFQEIMKSPPPPKK